MFCSCACVWLERLQNWFLFIIFLSFWYCGCFVLMTLKSNCATSAKLLLFARKKNKKNCILIECNRIPSELDRISFRNKNKRPYMVNKRTILLVQWTAFKFVARYILSWAIQNQTAESGIQNGCATNVDINSVYLHPTGLCETATQKCTI